MSTGNRIFASLAASLDGYIASADGDLAWLNDAMRREEDYGMGETMLPESQRSPGDIVWL